MVYHGQSGAYNTIVQSMKQLVLADFKLVFECW